MEHTITSLWMYSTMKSQISFTVALRPSSSVQGLLGGYSAGFS
jgi:hypothetical protein